MRGSEAQIHPNAAVKTHKKEGKKGLLVVQPERKRLKSHPIPSARATVRKQCNVFTETVGK